MSELVKHLVNEIKDLNDGWRDASVNPPEKVKNRYILVWGKVVLERGWRPSNPVYVPVIAKMGKKNWKSTSYEYDIKDFRWWKPIEKPENI